MSAAMCMLAPVGLAFWWWIYEFHQIFQAGEMPETDQLWAGALGLLFYISLYGSLPFLVSWLLGFLPFALRGRDRPVITSIRMLASITAAVGACWGIGFSIFLEDWIWIPGMTLAGIGPGLGYGLWLRGKPRVNRCA